MPIITAAARCLEETVRSGSIRKAAEILNLSASAVNRHILNLEAEYGIALLERLPRGVMATEAGHLMVARIRAWREEMAETSQQFDQLRGQGRRKIAIGLNECVAENLLPNVMAAMREAGPDISFSVTVGGSDDLSAALVAGKLDAVVAFNLRRSTDFWILSSVTIPVGVVTRKDHALAERESLNLADCVGHSIILADDSLTLRPLLDALFKGAGTTSDFLVTSNSIDVIKSAVGRGMGITLLTPLDIAGELQADSLRFICLKEPALNETLSIAVRDDREMPAATKLFCAEMTKEMTRASTISKRPV